MNKELILKKINKLDDKPFISKILDKASRAVDTGSIVHSDFIDPYQRKLVQDVLRGVEDVSYAFSGGYAGAEREVVVFGPYFMSAEDLSLPERFFKLLCITLSSRGSLTHRDYLGSLIGLGIKREKIGDILNDDDYCNIIILNEVAEFVKYNLQKVGNIKVETEIKDIGELKTPEPKVKLINATVASLRLDSISSAGFGMSRSKTADYIKAEKLHLNWQAVASPSKQVKEGDTISIRGKGRVQVEKVGGLTKKGRISVVLKRMV